MTKLLPKVKQVLLLSLIALLSACGGGSNDNNGRPGLGSLTPATSTGSITPIFESNTIEIYGDLEHESFGASGFAVIPKNPYSIDEISWLQTAGSTLQFLASNSQTIGFDVPESGSYSIQVQVKLQGESQLSTYNIDFSATGIGATTNIRLDHTVSELGKVSLHVGIPTGKNISSIEWQQLAGPEVNSLEKSDAYLFFDAPSVVSDEVIKFQAQVSYSDGTSGRDDVLITVKNINFNESGLFYNSNVIVTSDMFSANSSSPYKDALERCIYNNQIPGTPVCDFDDLPLIGTSTNGNTPSVEQILDRTLVSHQWMAEQFKYYLENSSAGVDMRNLLRGVTGVVISYDVRPSFYWAATGAIYLDANNFWQSPAERDTLNDVPDYRSDFGSDLQFNMLWRYTKNNDYYPNGRYLKQSRESRSFSDLEASISWLMYHELAHANDFFPSTVWANISPNITPLEYYNQNGTNSDILDQRYPLRSDEMHALAQVRYRNETPTTTQKSYKGDDIKQFFEPDIAPSFYAYLTTREDFAVLFERYMMLYRLDSEADVAISDSQTSSDYAITWGQRNRITDSSLADRTVFVVNNVYPNLQGVRSSLNELPSPILMDTSRGWFGNINISPSLDTTNRRKSSNKQQVDLEEQFKIDSNRDSQLGLPKHP